MGIFINPKMIHQFHFCIYTNIIWKDTHTPMFIATLFTVAKTWKQPKYPLTDEWIRKMWSVCVCVYIYIYTYIYMTMGYYYAIKKNEIMSFVATWMDLEIIILSKPCRKRQVSCDMVESIIWWNR